MSKWADFLISAVHYKETKDRKFIQSVMVHEDQGDTVSKPFVLERLEVVKKIEEGLTFCTIYKKDNKWIRGEDVHIVVIKNVKYIRTDNNNTPMDNLGNLPEF